MQPIHSIEYELTSELATNIERTLLGFEFRRGWRRDLPTYAAALVFAVLIVWLGLEGWIVPGIGSALLVLLTLFVIGALWRRWSMARTTIVTAILGLYAPDRRVLIDLGDQGMRMETEFFRGEGAWTELDEVVIFAGFWLLRLTNGGVVVIPHALISPELEAFIRDRAQSVLAPIRLG